MFNFEKYRRRRIAMRASHNQLAPFKKDCHWKSMISIVIFQLNFFRYNMEIFTKIIWAAFLDGQLVDPVSLLHATEAKHSFVSVLNLEVIKHLQERCRAQDTLTIYAGLQMAWFDCAQQSVSSTRNDFSSKTFIYCIYFLFQKMLDRMVELFTELKG